MGQEHELLAVCGADSLMAPLPAGSGHTYELTELIAQLPRGRAAHDDRDGDGLPDTPPLTLTLPPAPPGTCDLVGCAPAPAQSEIGYVGVQSRSSAGSSGAGAREQARACRLEQGASTALLARLGTALDVAGGFANDDGGHGGAAEGQCWAGFDPAALVRALAGPGLAPHQPVLARPLPLPAGGSLPPWPVIGLGSGQGARLELDAGEEEQGCQGVWGEYEQGRQFARGSFGEVWRAVRRRQSRRTQRGGAARGPPSAAEAGRPAGGDAGREEGFGEGAEQGFVLKRVLGGRGSEAWRSGRREEYFGRLFWPAQARAAAGDSRGGAGHLVRYVESLEVLDLCTCTVCSIVFVLQGMTLERLLAPMQSTAQLPVCTACAEQRNRVLPKSHTCLVIRTSPHMQSWSARADRRQPLAGVPRRGAVPARAHVRARGAPGCWRGGARGGPPARQRRRSLGDHAAQRVVVAAAAGSRGAPVGRLAPRLVPSGTLADKHTVTRQMLHLRHSDMRTNKVSRKRGGWAQARLPCIRHWRQESLD